MAFTQEFIDLFYNQFLNNLIVKNYFNNNYNTMLDKQYLHFLCNKIMTHPLTFKLYKNDMNTNFDSLIMWLLCCYKNSVKKNPYAYYIIPTDFIDNSHTVDEIYYLSYIITNYICPEHFENMSIDFMKVNEYEQKIIEEYNTIVLS